MKTKILFSFIVLSVLLSGCIVYSFYPLYTEKDLFPNDILTGEWIDDDDSDTDYEWKFEHPFIGKKENGIRDSLRYKLTVIERVDDMVKESVFLVHIIKLGGHYFLDFYLEEYVDDDNLDLSSFHIIPVHTFAKLTIKENQVVINWFDQEWLQDLIEENKIRIHHEQNDDIILLTAKAQELQKFVSKYVNSEEAFENGLEIILNRK